MQELAMRIFVCLGFVFAVSTAHAQTHGAMASHSSHSATTTAGSHTVINTRVSRFPNDDTYTTVSRGGYQSTVSSGYHPMGH
jgi:hypothetical protein